MEHMLQTGSDVRQFADKTIAVIGPSCADELSKYHLRPDIMPAVHDTQHLLQDIQKNISPGIVWHPCAAGSTWQGIAELATAGFEPTAVPMYRQEARSAVMRLTGETVDAVCLSSPSAVRRYVKYMIKMTINRSSQRGLSSLPLAMRPSVSWKSMQFPCITSPQKPPPNHF